jgi:predicted transcriptional regulator
LFPSTIKSVNKPFRRFYPLKLETIGDHLRTKRLDLGLSQKDLEGTLEACQKTILLWEKSIVKPHPEAVAKIIGFFGYCLVPKTPARIIGVRVTLLGSWKNNRGQSNIVRLMEYSGSE